MEREQPETPKAYGRGVAQNPLPYWSRHQETQPPPQSNVNILKYRKSKHSHSTYPTTITQLQATPISIRPLPVHPPTLSSPLHLPMSAWFKLISCLLGTKLNMPLLGAIGSLLSQATSSLKWPTDANCNTLLFIYVYYMQHAYQSVLA